ncbi:alpha/beta-hydrolase [Linnemannia elongata AG-77]|uniref:Alpha/beta-hydrolase n=1 Tax=Linnemannia elongata AG-77 TaxID=1314771 RepID=A0A197K7L2_9FUNG|nr:alpha/beta-hydrolase [Linnemannia elongata AG-77]
MAHSFTQSFTHSLTQEQDNATRLHLSPTTEHHTNSHPAPSLELKLASLRRSQPAGKSSTPHTPQPLQLPNDVVSMAKLGVFFSVFFPPVSVFMVTMLPLVLLGVVAVFYVLTWVVYAQTAARPLKFSSFPWDPRRILKLNRILFLSTIPTNISLIPVAFSLIKYRLWTMRGSQGLVVDVHYNSKRPYKTLDVHAPDLTTQQAAGKQTGRPVVIFIYGGAWSSGSKKFYTLLGAQLRIMGYVAVIPDYTTFPRGLSKEMEEDVQMAIQWTQEHCETYGGDPNKIYLMGHSAGAHLCSLTIFKDCVRQWMNTTRKERQELIKESPVLAGLLQECALQEEMSLKSDKGLGRPLLRLRGLILCSGVYDISAHLEHEKIRGVEEVSAMSRVMGNSLISFGMNSPSMILQEIARTTSSLSSSTLPGTSSAIFDAAKINDTQEGTLQSDNHLSHFRSLLPEKFLVVHGEDDRTVPASSSVRLHSALQSFLSTPSDAVRLHVISNMMHQAPIVAIMPSFKAPSPFAQPLVQLYRDFIEDADGTNVSIVI